MTTNQKQLIKATIPTLKEHGQLLTTHFYQRVFAHHPELKNVFNQANQQSGRQPMALASAVLAYAEHIDNPAVLESALVRIGHKHTSLDIRPEQYPVVGHHLLASIREVLGEAATPELLDAWGAAYDQLARLMMGIETDLYATQQAKPGGWTGWRLFVINAKIQEPDGTTTLHLYPTDGALVAEHVPGQYVSLRLFLPELQLHQPNQYRLTNAPNCTHYCISVKCSADGEHTLNDLFSRHLREVIQTGYCVELSAPAGVVVPKVETPAMVRPSNKGGCPMHV